RGLALGHGDEILDRLALGEDGEDVGHAGAGRDDELAGLEVALLLERPAAGAEDPLAGDQLLALEPLRHEPKAVVALDEEAGLRLDRTVGIELAGAEQEQAAGDDEADHHEAEKRVEEF